VLSFSRCCLVRGAGAGRGEGRHGHLDQIEVYPTSAIFREGDRIRLTIGSADTPATSAPLPALADSLGGEIRVLHGGRYASHVLLPVAPD
jgi:predicted acyl esterase